MCADMLHLTFNQLTFQCQLLSLIAYRKDQPAILLWQGQYVPSALACKRPAIRNLAHEPELGMLA